MLRPRFLIVSALCLAATLHARADEPSHDITLNECRVIGRVGTGGRVTLHRDAVEARLVAGTWTPPHAGDTLRLPDGSSRTWATLRPADGSFSHPALHGGYASFTVRSQVERVMVLEASGHVRAFVNGEPRGGDPYGYGYVHLPVLLRQGENDLLFQVARGSLRARLVPPQADAFFNAADTTLPDLLAGQPVATRGSLVVVNATTRPQDRLRIDTSTAGGESVTTRLPSLLPLSARKVVFRMAAPPVAKAGSAAVTLRLVRESDGREQLLDTATLSLSVLRPDHTHKRTFVSHIDGSVQYYAVVPVRGRPDDPGRKHKPALILTLHGASVEANRQAACFQPKDWAYVVAPTNRRPYGFDWEDWGRTDALEVLELARRTFDTDPRRTYLTGHSMGGHGTWHVGVTFPDRFAAIGPSAGWISMWSYAGARHTSHPTPMGEMLERATRPSDTLALAHNYAAEGVFVLHGDRDDNVPVEQAREMRRVLGGFHPDFVYHEQPGAGHWWGDRCVDWPPMLEFFRQRVLPRPEEVARVDFATASPGVSARCHWAVIETQLHPLRLSSIHLRHDAERHRFSGTTENVGRLRLEITDGPPGKPVEVELDGQTLITTAPAGQHHIQLERRAGRWRPVQGTARGSKGPHRYGPFKEVFGNRVLLVYGTHGTPEDNAWALARARYDAETFGYRGNGSLDVLADTAFAPAAEPDRSVVLYGNATTNAAWRSLLPDSPVQVLRDRVKVGDREVKGADLACVFVRPRPGSDRALVGAVAGTGPAGMRRTAALGYFTSGVAYPDCLVFGPAVLSGGQGVRAAGYFGPDWGLASGEFVWGK